MTDSLGGRTETRYVQRRMYASGVILRQRPYAYFSPITAMRKEPRTNSRGAERPVSRSGPAPPGFRYAAGTAPTASLPRVPHRRRTAGKKRPACSALP
jgi:hypothetical protein